MGTAFGLYPGALQSLPILRARGARSLLFGRDVERSFLGAFHFFLGFGPSETWLLLNDLRRSLQPAIAFLGFRQGGQGAGASRSSSCSRLHLRHTLTVRRLKLLYLPRYNRIDRIQVQRNSAGVLVRYIQAIVLQTCTTPSENDLLIWVLHDASAAIPSNFRPIPLLRSLLDRIADRTVAFKLFSPCDAWWAKGIIYHHGLED
mmetsp:Transcript_73082/g.161322  ORF Transcript_73082/g.161322 Transcript_73082/m.161322 type:complete len:203 (-) Transcript_73082:431-1039(-)